MQVGVKIVKKACQEPCFLIAQNAGFEGAVVVQQVLKGTGNTGFNAYEGEMVDMMQAGIIDPVKVVRIGLQDASSVATMLTTTEAMIVQVFLSSPFPPCSPDFRCWYLHALMHVTCAGWPTAGRDSPLTSSPRWLAGSGGEACRW